MKCRYPMLLLLLMCLAAGRSSDRLISLYVRDADVLDVIHLLAVQSGIGIMTEGPVRFEKVTMYMRSVPFQTALRVLLQTHHLQAHSENNILIITNEAKYVKRPRVPRVPFAPAIVGRSPQDVVITRRVFLLYLRPSDVLQRLENAVPQGSYVADDRARTLVVTASPRVQNRVGALLRDLDVASCPIAIDVQIVDVVPDGGDATAKFLSDSVDSSGAYTLVRNSKDIEESLDSLSRHGDAHVIASPHIDTLNNRQAELALLQTYPEALDDPNVGQQVQFVRIGIKITVTPTLDSQGGLRIRLHPEYSAVESFSEGHPLFEERSLDATLHVGSQQTVVFGGALNDIDARVVNKIPALADDSAFGKLFRRRSRAHGKDIIVFLIVPRTRGAVPHVGKVHLSVPVPHGR